MKFLMTVSFKAEPTTIEVEGKSLKDVWTRRFDLAAGAEPMAWEVHPTDVEEAEAGGEL